MLSLVLSIIEDTASHLDENTTLGGFLIGGGTVGGLALLFMRGILKNNENQWKIVKEYRDQNESLRKENDELHVIAEDQRSLVYAARQEIALCNVERQLQDVKIKNIEEANEELRMMVKDLHREIASFRQEKDEIA